MIRDVRLDVLRSLSIFAVVLIHVVSIMDNQINFHAYEVASWIIKIVNQSLFWCVPVFFMLSGALLLDRSDESIRQFYTKRINKIVIPTLFWSTFFLIYLVIFQHFTFFNIMGAILKGKPFYHLWFMYAIIGVYLFTPFIRILLENLRDDQIKWLVASIMFVTIFSNYIGNYFHNQENIFTLFLPYIGYFILGHYLYKNQLNQKKYKKIYSYAFAVGTLLISASDIILNSIYTIRFPIISYYSPFVAMEAILFFLYFITKDIYIKNSSMWIFLSTLSFGVYLIHPIFILWIEHFSVKIEQAVYLPLYFLFVLAGSYSTVYILKKMKYLQKLV